MQDAKIEVIAFEPNDTIVYLKHNWENQCAHVMRSDGKLRRCIIGKIILTKDGEMTIGVRFREMHRQTQTVCEMQKSVSPLNLLFANELWLRTNVLSESEGEADGFDARDYDEMQPRNSALPWFEHEDASRLERQQRRKLQWMTTQVHGFQIATKGMSVNE